MNETYIEWALCPDGSPGYTSNPISGCENHTPEGLCLGGLFPCYAWKLAHGRLKPLYLANEDYAPVDVSNIDMLDPADDPFYPRFWDRKLHEIDRLSSYYKPKGIFVCDMGDLFGIGVPNDWATQVLWHIKHGSPYDRFYLLTKQPQNLPEFSPFPENAWVGVTVCNDKMLDVAVDKLEDVQARVKFISFEPLLERLSFSLDYAFYYSGISWLIIGACTGTKLEMGRLSGGWLDFLNRVKPYGNKWTLQPKIEWVREIVEAADKAEVKVFLKDNLQPILPTDKPFYKGKHWHAGGMWELRQELPKC